MCIVQRDIFQEQNTQKLSTKAQAKPLLRAAFNAQGTRVMSRNEEIMQKIENNENVWERTRDESPELLTKCFRDFSKMQH